jgi:tight adherence protein C
LIDGVEGATIGLAFVAGSMILPSRMLENKVKERKDNILDVFPEMLRLMVDATSTGHTIEDAIMRVSRKYPNELSEELKKVEEEAKVTSDWIMGLENMALRCNLFEISSFVSEVKTTKQRGTSVSDTLLSFAKKMDKETTIRMTEIARKKSTTLLVPLLIFLFMPLIIMIMIPALNQVMSTF